MSAEGNRLAVFFYLETEEIGSIFSISASEKYKETNILRKWKYENTFLYTNLSYKKQTGAGFPCLLSEVMCKAVRLKSKRTILLK